MTEKDLIAKLNNLKAIVPDNEWKSRNREILLSQISGGSEDKVTSFFSLIDKLLPAKVLMLTSRPAMMFFLIVAVVFGSGVASLYAARGTKPGDSLYIAKIISEKTQLAMTFDETSKAKLNLEFASNRTQEITQVINESNDKKAATIQGLTNDFKDQMSAAKTRLAKIDSDKADAKVQTNDNRNNNNNNNNNDEKVTVFGANVAKDSSGVQISDPSASLDEAQQLFDKKDYSATIDKIEEINKIINNPETENSAATTTPTEKATSTDKTTATSTK